MADEVQRLVLEVVNREKIDHLNLALKDEEAALKRLAQEFRAGKIAQDAFDAAAQTSAGHVLSLQQQIKKLENSSSQLKSQGLLQLSYVLDDLTNTSGGWERKLASISNNIPGLVAGLGGPAGIAGGIGLVATAAIAATPVIKKLIEAFTGPDGIPQVKLELEDAAARVKRLQGELDAIMKSRPMQEKETADLVKSYLAEENPEQIGFGLAGALEQSGRGAKMNEDEARRMRTLKAALGGQIDPEIKERIAKLEAEINKRTFEANRATAGQLMAEAPTSAAARAQIRDLAGKFPTLFRRGFGEGLGELEPEAIAAQDADVAATEEEGRKAIERGTKRRAREAQQRAWEAQGLKNSRQFLRQKRLQEERDEAAEQKALEHDDEVNLRNWRNAKKQHARDEAAEDRASARDDAENLRDFTRAKKTAPFRRAKSEVTAAAEQLGFGRPTDTQAEEMAREVVALTRQGVGTNDAILAAIRSKALEIQRLQQRLMQQQAEANQLMMGSDFNGQFPQLP